MAPRANWKGFFKIADVICPVALYTAASASDQISFHTLNRATGHRVQRQFVDSETGKPVERDEQVKGYQVGAGDYIVLEPEEIAAAIPESDKTLTVTAFIASTEIDDVYFDKPYYLAPADRQAHEVYTLLRDGMRAQKVAALAQAVLFRRVRTVLVRPDEHGMIATTLNFDYEVRSAESAFEDISKIAINKEMLDLAEHIIKTKSGTFDPSQYVDRYEAALADLVKAKLAGRPIERRQEPKRAQVVDLMAVLRESAGLAKKTTQRTPAKAKAARGRKTAAPRRKAG